MFHITYNTAILPCYKCIISEQESNVVVYPMQQAKIRTFTIFHVLEFVSQFGYLYRYIDFWFHADVEVSNLNSSIFGIFPNN